MGNKVFELTDEEQRNLFCAAWHLTNLIEDYKENIMGDLARPCMNCRYQKECYKDGYCDGFEKFQTLTKLTGVVISPLVGLRESGFSFLIEPNEVTYGDLKNTKFKDLEGIAWGNIGSIIKK